MLLWRSVGSLGICVGSNGIHFAVCAVLPVPVSGSLGEEPWEVDGRNNEGWSSVTWQALPSKLCRLCRLVLALSLGKSVQTSKEGQGTSP